MTGDVPLHPVGLQTSPPLVRTRIPVTLPTLANQFRIIAQVPENWTWLPENFPGDRSPGAFSGLSGAVPGATPVMGFLMTGILVRIIHLLLQNTIGMGQ